MKIIQIKDNLMYKKYLKGKIVSEGTANNTAIGTLTFLPPEVVDAYYKNKNEKHKYNIFKVDSYSFALTLLILLKINF